MKFHILPVCENNRTVSVLFCVGRTYGIENFTYYFFIVGGGCTFGVEHQNLFCSLYLTSYWFYSD